MGESVIEAAINWDHMFSQFKYARTKWCVLLIIFKVVLLIITTLGENFFEDLIYLLPAFYFLTTLIHFIRMSYMNIINNIVDGGLGVINFLFSSIPILAKYDISVSENAILILTIASIVLPIIAIVLLFLTDKTEEKRAKFDMSIYTKYADDEMLKRTMFIREKLDEVKKKPEEDDENDPNITKFRTIRKKIKEVKYDKNPGDAKEDILRKEANCGNFGYQDDQVEVQLRDYYPIERWERLYAPGRRRLPSNPEEDDANPEELIKVDKRFLARQTKDLYKLIDKILDGKTMGFIRKCLQIMVFFGVLASGFYVSSIQRDRMSTTEVFC